MAARLMGYVSASNTPTIVAGGGITVDYLVIAGGGSASWTRGGGGGAGGYRNSVSGELTGGGGSAETPLTLALNTNYLVQVGAGGTGAAGGGIVLIPCYLPE